MTRVLQSANVREEETGKWREEEDSTRRSHERTGVFFSEKRKGKEKLFSKGGVPLPRRPDVKKRGEGAFSHRKKKEEGKKRGAALGLERKITSAAAPV